MRKIAMLGTGLIGTYYTKTLHHARSQDRVVVVYSRTDARARQFAETWGIPAWTADLSEAIRHPEAEVVVIGLPNHLHEQAALTAAEHGKAVLCTKPLGRNAAEAKRMLDAVEEAGVFHGYLEDLAYTPKTLRALVSVRSGAIGKVLSTRSIEGHSGPHSDWFWDEEQAGGGVIIDLGSHCIEISRNFIGKDVKPVEVMCWAGTQVHPIAAEDHAIGLVRYASGAIGQFEVSWTFRGGMDLRDEVAGTQGTIWLNHWLRTGLDVFSAVGEQGFVAEKSEGATGWLFPVGDEIGALGYATMFADMLTALDNGTAPMETFYDGYVVNAIMDAAYQSARSKQWEPVILDDWRGAENTGSGVRMADYDADHVLIKREVLPDGRVKVILLTKSDGRIIEQIVDA
jgi:predicted dehydrogenase